MLTPGKLFYFWKIHKKWKSNNKFNLILFEICLSGLSLTSGHENLEHYNKCLRDNEKVLLSFTGTNWKVLTKNRCTVSRTDFGSSNENMFVLKLMLVYCTMYIHKYIIRVHMLYNVHRLTITFLLPQYFESIFIFPIYKNTHFYQTQIVSF